MPQVRKDSSPLRSARRWVVQFMLPLAAGAGLIAGVLWLSQMARDDLRRRGEQVIAFTDIQCRPPEGMKRAEFLDEARHLAGLPEQIDILDESATDRIRAALAAHPWVLQVRRVTVSPDGVRAEVDYRVALLWVESTERAADADGVLLPVSARREGLPILAGKVTPPSVTPGQPWNDPAVEAASKVMALLWPERKTLALTPCRLALQGGEVWLRRGQQRIIWGRPPGQEKPGEPDAAAKVERLKKAGREGEVDLRK